MSPVDLHSVSRSLCVALAALAFTGSVRGQYAHGDGRALDHNLSATDGRLNRPVSRFRLNLADYNNALITGNVPGGRGFRGDVGYTGAFDFRGSLATDDLFQFEADAYRGGIGENLLIPRRGERFDSVILPRLRGGPSSRIPSVDEGGPRIDPTWGLGVPRQSSDRPSFRLDDAEAESRLVLPSIALAAPETDFRQLPTVRVVGSEEESEEPQRPRFLLPELNPRPVRGENVAEDAPPAEPEGTVTEARPAGRRMPEFVPVRDARMEMLAELAAQMWNLELPTDDRQPWSPELEAAVAELDSTLQDFTLRAQRSGSSQAPLIPESVPAELVEMSRVQGPVVARLSGQQGGRMQQRLRDAEEALRDGRYGEAEALFTQVLQYDPSDGLAALGRVHSQIGAGLYRTAAIDLRTLLTRHPELIPAKVIDDLRPPDVVLERGVEVLRTFEGAETGEERLVFAAWADSPLLLAYIGRLLDRDSEVLRGLEEQARRNDRDPLLRLLAAGWLEVETEEGEK